MKKISFILLIFLSVVSCHKDKLPAGISYKKGVTTAFTLPASAVTLNPSGNAPLSALLKFTSPFAGHTEIIVIGKHGDASNLSQVFTDNSTTHSIPVVGLYPDYKNTVIVSVVDGSGTRIEATVNITTGKLPADMPTNITVDVVDTANMQPGLNLVSSFNNFPNVPLTPYMVDSFGDIRWLLDFHNNAQLNHLYYDCGISRLQNGNYFFADSYSSKIYEIDILGKIRNTWGMGGYTFHHEVYEKPNGNFLMTATKPGSTKLNGTPSIMDYVIEIDRKSGNIINTWDLKESLDEYRNCLSKYTPDTTDWIHENGIFYNAPDSCIILSGRVQGVVKLTNDNHVKWILAPHMQWGRNRRGEDLNQFLLTPLDATGNAITDASVISGLTNRDDFGWNFCQHSPIPLPNGNLMVFDNGDERNFDTVSSKPHYSRALELKIDETNMTVQQVWEYGKETGSTTYSKVVSSVKYLPNNHILFSPGYQVPNAIGSGGKIIEVDHVTKKVIFQMSISSANAFSHHRVYRYPLYPNGNPYQE